MKITLKCFACLGHYLPPGAKGNTVELEVEEGKTVQQVIADLHIDAEMVEIAILNDVFVDATARDNMQLKDQDTLALWPEVAGG